MSIYYAGKDWKLMHSFDVDTLDMQDIRWINYDSAIIVWDTALESKIFIYSVATGDLISKYEPDSACLGIKTLSIAPCQSLLAAGLYDGSIVLYNNLQAQEIASLQHLPHIDLNLPSAKTLYVYKEELSKDSTDKH